MAKQKLTIMVVLFIAGSLLILPASQVEGNISPQVSSASGEAYWKGLASNAWRYYQPGAGVDSTTGLVHTNLNYPGFNDWDSGVYIQSVIDMSKLGLLNNSGEWGFDDRINKFLTFLENRPLTSSGAPYAWYSSINGQPTAEHIQIACDAANMLIALKNLANYRPELATRIDNIVNVRTDYKPLKIEVEWLADSLNIYDYFATAGFAAFWPERFSSQANTMLNNIANAPTAQTHGVSLPKAKLMWEPILLAIFGLEPDATMLKVANQVYLAHEARYNDTDKFVTFSEGNPEGIITSYIWQWVVLPDGRTWIIQPDEFNEVSVTPAVFLKTAASMCAIYNTQFTQNMLGTMEPTLLTASGYFEGISEDGNTMPIVSDNNNGMIISAARYAVDKQVSEPTPAPNPSALPSSTLPASTPPLSLTPNPSIPLPTPSATTNPTFTITPSPSSSSSPDSSTVSHSPPTSLMPSENSPTPEATISASAPNGINEFPDTATFVAVAIAVAAAFLLSGLTVHLRRKHKNNTQVAHAHKM